MKIFLETPLSDLPKDSTNVINNLKTPSSTKRIYAKENQILRDLLEKARNDLKEAKELSP